MVGQFDGRWYGDWHGADDRTAPAPSSAEVFQARSSRWIFRPVKRMADEYTFEPIVKDPDAGKRVRLVMTETDECSDYWQRNEYVAFGAYRRPRQPTGYVYLCLQAGTTGKAEPNWPKTEGGRVTDGSCLWIAMAAVDQALNELYEPVVVSEPPGLTFENVRVVSGTAVEMDILGGQLDRDYDAKVTVSMASLVRVLRQTVRIRKT